MDCTVCAENFNKSTHKAVTCPGCEFTAGRSCIERYFLTSNNDYQCMNCHILWTDEFVKTHLSLASVKRLKQHREEILFEREKTFMPETQPYVLREIYQDKRLELQHKHRTYINTNHHVLLALKELKEIDPQIYNDLNAIHARCLDEQHNVREELHDLQNNAPPAIMGTMSSRQGTQGYKTEIILACPKDECKGYITKQHRCGLCNTEICKHCHEPLNPENDTHECLTEHLESAKLVRESTKPCPKCATRIHRIDGCTQMWCTQCNTSFDYRTGEIYTRNIHNPHYFEWLRRNPDAQQFQENVQVNQANGCVALNLNLIIRHVRGNNCDSILKDKMMHMIRHHFHLEHIKNQIRVRDNQDPFRRYLTMRMAWMRNKLSDKQFKQKLQQEEKRNMLALRKRQVLETCTQVTEGLCRRILEAGSVKSWKTIHENYEQIIEYTKECFSNLESLYQNKMPWIDMN